MNQDDIIEHGQDGELVNPIDESIVDFGQDIVHVGEVLETDLNKTEEVIESDAIIVEESIGHIPELSVSKIKIND